MAVVATLLLALSISIPSDTTVVLARTERDLTGDKQAEVLKVVGVGRTIDSLDVTFTIESAGRVLYRMKFASMTRTVGYGSQRQVISAAEHRDRLREFAGWFLDEKNFLTPAGFLTMLRESGGGPIEEIPLAIRDGIPTDTLGGRLIWEEMQKSPITIFTFSAGYDSFIGIGWSPSEKRFVKVLSCC